MSGVEVMLNGTRFACWQNQKIFKRRPKFNIPPTNWPDSRHQNNFTFPTTEETFDILITSSAKRHDWFQ